MALKHSLIVGALLISFSVTDVAVSQVNIPSPRFRFKEIESPDATRPHATPGVFDYDAQMFAPLEFTNGKQKAPNTGFYFGLDKTYLSVDKAGLPVGSNDGTVTDMIQTGSTYIWGTRYQFGWFSDEDDGWGASYQDSNGIYYTNGQDISVSNPMLVDMQFANFEINRMFRQPLSRGGYFEPYIGARYTYLSDDTLEDTPQIVNGVIVGNRFKQEVTNSVFGFQAGGRYNVRRGRWKTTVESAIVTSYNQQRYFASDISNFATSQGISETYQSDQSFVPIIEGEYDVSYNISRDISLHLGVQAIYAWSGIVRANTLTTNINPNSVFGSSAGGATGLFDTSFVSVGFIFGCEWRR